MNLLLDFGNTNTKIAVYNNKEIVDSHTFKELQLSDIKNLKHSSSINNVILSSVSKYKEEIKNYLRNNFENFIELNSNTPIPIELKYTGKQTLGNDRIATSVGANNIFPNTNVLVIDMGTAITFDFINSKNQFVGGNISPGVNLRLKSLNEHTHKLPLVKKNKKFQLIGTDTNSAILFGVENGILFEVEGYINKLKNEYKNLKIILTGGDTFLFEKMIKNPIFVKSNLLFQGLNRILNYNVKNN
ncbi:MAG: type III pantothenate kinase [Bacteroidales bacterium]|nr:type III pantothenate kinase [Bacteroidales bacterium]